tara:strand:- start:2089 stop:2697 length:609 start_codon:yes stop_codon:yes gene_type:complete
MKDLLNELEIIVDSEMHHKTDLEYYQFLKENEHIAAKLLNEVNYPQLIGKNNSVINSRAGKSAYKRGTSGDFRQDIQNDTRPGDIDLVSADMKNFLFQFSVPGDGWPNSKPRYQVDIKFDKDGRPSLTALDVKVKCNCPFFIYNGPEYQAKSDNYLFGNPGGTATPPDIRDPNRAYYICKHIAAVFDLIRARFRLPAHYFKV